jgi:LmbE family N-acetylglucosaminyl deacetylase
MKHDGRQWVTQTLRKVLAREKPLLLHEMPWPAGLRLLALAPHPDDFDAVGVTLRFFHDRGDEVRLSVISSSPHGVTDGFCSPPTAAAKTALREEEQRQSCALFGLPPERIIFLRLAEDDSGHPSDSAHNRAYLEAHIRDVGPDIVLMPHGNDTNAGHRFAFRALQHCAGQPGPAIVALLNRDPKTVEMRTEIYTFFGEEEARWKAGLLRCHQSQHQRNLETRGYGLDERILRVNRRSAADLPGRGPYAEAFEIWCSGSAGWDATPGW